MKDKNLFPESFHKKPVRPFIGFCVIMLCVGIASLCGVEILWKSLISEKSRAIFMVAASVLLLFVVAPGLLLGYEIAPDGFTIRILWFKLHHAPGDEVAQVVRIIKPYYNLYKKDAKIDYLCVTPKPADPLPYFQYSAVRSHWWMNFMPVWNIPFLNMDHTGGRCIDYIEKYWG